MSLPPFINSTGLIGKIFEKIQQAKVPPRYTQDFQATVLGYGSGSAKPFIPFLKRLGFIQSDGTPTELYTRFRNADSSGAAMAEAMRLGFSEIFRKNEFAHALPDEKLKNLVVEITGKEPGDGTVTAIVGSFKACKQLADFDTASIPVEEKLAPLQLSKSLVKHEPKSTSPADLRLAYTININLPETTDVNVYNAIFSAIRENLLTNE
ncbi:DUF5343 domain-containing protein [Rhizobium ruizarguesonis]|uniref:DUF5343 domain-containing protein n=1 Tax=Rhizobium ruizarguesonis TaxID=2081791 RepID=UPI0013BA502D|nr:DUF5343 domain-containing protein [Rhizobium ruizarguesonis]NEH64588.1 hypothetical protein [Rhizobium ruizarguesonis]NEH78080.1 hypothetical protein [Rhizobium ruizarguesonis]NEI78511.1 hypothetical protein [Rhizobium ruizarguesonis]